MSLFNKWFNKDKDVKSRGINQEELMQEESNVEQEEQEESEEVKELLELEFEEQEQVEEQKKQKK